MGFKVELNIKDDKELRDTIKDMIAGQVRGVTREEITAEIKDTIHRKAEATQISQWGLEKIINKAVMSFIAGHADEIKRAVIDELKAECRPKIVEVATDMMTKNIDKMFRTAVEKKMQKMPVQVVVGGAE